jgi:hypothetical protein
MDTGTTVTIKDVMKMFQHRFNEDPPSWLTM